MIGSCRHSFLSTAGVVVVPNFCAVFLGFPTPRIGIAVSRIDLASELWGYDSDVYLDNLKFHVSRLRKKLGDEAEKPQFIKTLRGKGCRLVAPEELPKNHTKPQPNAIK